MRLLIWLGAVIILAGCNNAEKKEFDVVASDTTKVVQAPRLDTTKGLFVVSLTRDYATEIIMKTDAEKKDITAEMYRRIYQEEVLYKNNIDTSVITDGLKYVFFAKLDSQNLNVLEKDKRIETIRPFIERYMGTPVRALGICNPASEVQWGVQFVWNGNNHVNGTYGTAWLLDTGVDPACTDLNIKLSITFIGGVLPKDEDGHGSMMAGIIGGKKDAKGIVGVAPNAIIKSIRIFDKARKLVKKAYLDALDYVLANGVKGDVLNLSIESTSPYEPEEIKRIEDIAAKGIYVCISAGNGSVDVDGTWYPAALNGPNIFTVSSMDIKKEYSWFSNYGKSSVDYSGPGEGICSCFLGGTFYSGNGTSQATAHLTGLMLLKGKVNSVDRVSKDPDGKADIMIHE